MENYILVEKNNSIALVTMNRPKALNSLHPDLIAQLISNLHELENDAEIRAIVLTGEGRAFCAGGDLPHLESLNDVVAARQYIEDAGNIVYTIMNMKKPVIGMVNGVAAGAGFNIALACDIVFCSDQARFAQSFANIALIPDCGGTYLLPRVVGLKKAKELMFTGDLIDAKTALDYGIVNKIVESSQLKEETMKFAEKIAHGAPLALALIKKTLNQSFEMNFAEALENEKNMQTLCLQTADNKEGIKAFKEKRKANFKGV